MEGTDKIALKFEIQRKLIHLISTFIPLLYWLFFEKKEAIIIVSVAFVLMILLDLGKRYSEPVRLFYFKYLGTVLRKDEQLRDGKLFTGGTFHITGVFLSVLLFDKNIAIASMLVMMICDSFAAISGKWFGKIKIGNKTLEGSTFFFITGVLLIMYVFPLGNTTEHAKFFAVIALFITTLFELIPSIIDDNISIPVVYGITYTLLIYFLR